MNQQIHINDNGTCWVCEGTGTIRVTNAPDDFYYTYCPYCSTEPEDRPFPWKEEGEE
jgi:excinuclease UvrABC ATPase subunit